MRLIHSAFAVLLLAGCTGDTNSDSSTLSDHGSNGSATDDDCTYTQGYWKNHPDAWPVSSVKLGSVTYTKVELLAIFHAPVKGNGLIQLAHQLIAAKLNIAAGASDASIKSAITQADALIGNLVCPPKGTGEISHSSLVDKLDDFNSGKTGPGHCGEHANGGGDDDHGDDDDDNCSCPSAPVCGNGIKETGEQCDDGNTADQDGCSAICTIEVPICGNGIQEVGESCDDGNQINGDGCSSACACECP